MWVSVNEVSTSFILTGKKEGRSRMEEERVEGVKGQVKCKKLEN